MRYSVIIGLIKLLVLGAPGGCCRGPFHSGAWVSPRLQTGQESCPEDSDGKRLLNSGRWLGGFYWLLSPQRYLISVELVGRGNEGRKLPIAVESWELLAFLGASLSCVLLRVRADNLGEGMLGARNIPWELTNSGHAIAGSPLDLGPHVPADLTFICSPFVLHKNTLLLSRCLAFGIWGVLLWVPCVLLLGCRHNYFRLSPLLEGARLSVVLSALHGAYLIILINKQSLINNTGNIIM